MARRGLLFVVSGPSGAGKSSLCQGVLSEVSGLRHSISYTTRQPRPGEQHGTAYYFVSEREFREMTQQYAFAEWAPVYGHLYGTPRRPIDEAMEEGLDVILDIDAQGAMQIKKKYEDAISIYIMPPSIETLRRRLVQRAGDSDEAVQRRLQKAREEIWQYRGYSYIIKNDGIGQAQAELKAVILAERIRTHRVDMAWLEDNFILNKSSAVEQDESCTEQGSMETHG